MNNLFGLISVERLNQTFLQVLKFLPGAPHATRHLFTSEPFSWLDFKLAVEERQCIHFQEELNPYRLNCKDNSCLAKSEDFPPESKKFIYCFPILLLSVSAGQRAGQRPLHLQHSYWLSQTNLSDSLIVPHKHESLIATNIYLV